jgi:hypothetical protein
MKSAVAVVIVIVVACGIASSQPVEERTSVAHPYTAITAGALDAEPERAKALLESAEKGYDSLLAGYGVGTVPFRELYPWSKRWMEIEVSAAKSKADARKALAAHVSRMTARFKTVEALQKTGTRGGESENYHVASFAKVEAEILLLRAGGELPAENAP